MNLLRRIAWWLSHRRHEAELAEEVAYHEELKQRELVGRGVAASDIVGARRRAMGNATWMREESRGIWIWPWLDQLLQDIRYALRSARRSPAFSLGVIAITALGIGATTTMFSVVDGVLLRPLPYPAAKRLIYFDWGSHSPPKYRDWQRAISSVDLWAAGWDADLDLTGSGRPERLSAARVTPEFFRLFGARAGAGRLFSTDDFHGEGSAVILGRRFWLRRFGGDSSIVGKTIELGGRAVVVAG
ncbi:MAG: ABC transporter permease, partial [Gemmatimonadota bacterium]